MKDIDDSSTSYTKLDAEISGNKRARSLNKLNLNFKLLGFFLIEILIEFSYALIYTGYSNNNLYIYVKLVAEKVYFRLAIWLPLLDHYLQEKTDGISHFMQQNVTRQEQNSPHLEFLFRLIFDIKSLLILAILVRWYLIVLNVRRLFRELTVNRSVNSHVFF